MKILIDCRNLQTYSAFRGIGRYTRQLIRVCRDDPGCFFLFFNEKNRKNETEREVFIKSPRRLITYSDRILLRKLIIKRRMNAYHSTAFALPSKPEGKKFILTVHDLTPIKFPRFSSLRHRYIFKKIIASARQADLVLTVSQNTADDLLTYLSLDPDRVRVVYNALDDRLNSDSAVKPAIDLPSEYLLYTGGCDSIKNVETVVRAANLVNIPLVIAGFVDERKKKELLYLVSGSYRGSIYFTGYIPDPELSYLYQHAVLFLFPSLYEGFGYPPLEAIQCGTTPLVSKTGALVEILGDAAFYVDNPRDHRAFAEQIGRIAVDSQLRKSLLPKGKAILKKYSLEVFRKKIHEVYTGLMDR
jgi:glycosyltransferase involved in cell wall biosynthesis